MPRSSVPPPSPTGNRRVIAGGPWHHFDDPVGRVKLVIRNAGMMYVEDKLDDRLDKMNDRIAVGRGPVDPHTGDRVIDEFGSVWEALPYLWQRWPHPTVHALLVAALESTQSGPPEARLAEAERLFDEIDETVLDEDLVEKLMVSVNLALGADPDEPRPPMAPPTTVDGARSASDGTSSSPSGPPRSASVASVSPSTPSTEPPPA